MSHIPNSNIDVYSHTFTLKNMNFILQDLIEEKYFLRSRGFPSANPCPDVQFRLCLKPKILFTKLELWGIQKQKKNTFIACQLQVNNGAHLESPNMRKILLFAQFKFI